MIYLILFVVTIVLRIPFMSEAFYYIDKVYYVHSLKYFMPTGGLPCSSGYILWIHLAKLFLPFVGDPYQTFVTLSVISSGAATCLLYRLGHIMFSKRAALYGALLFMTSPLIWFHGCIGFSYMFVAMFSLLLVILVYQSIQTKEVLYAYLASLVYGLLGGFRPQDMPILFFVWLLAIWRLPLKHLVGCLALSCLAVLYWLYPLAQFSGGLSAFIESYFQGNGGILSSDPIEIVNRIGGNCEKFFKFLIRGLGLSFPLFIWAGYRFKKDVIMMKDPRVRVLGAWLFPSLIFFLGLYLGNPGHMFASFPIYFLIVGFTLAYYLKLRIQIYVLSGMILVNASLFLVDLKPNESWEKITWYKASDINKRNRDLLDKVEYIKENFEAETTLILGDLGGRGHLFQIAYYLPEFSCLALPLTSSPDDNQYQLLIKQRPLVKLQGGRALDLQGIKTLIFLDKDLIALAKKKFKLKEVSMKHNSKLYWIDVNNRQEWNWRVL